jgi:hypothetical protein
VAAAKSEARTEAAAVTEQIVICYSGSEDAERAVDAAAALPGPAAAIVIGSRGRC